FQKNTQANDFEDISEIIKALNISTDDFAIRTTRFWKINFAPDGASSKVAHVQKIEPLTISELNEYVIAAQPQAYSLILKDLKAFAEAIDVVRDKGVAMAVAVASAEDIDAANVHVQTFSEVKKAL
ncbi:unnamed protein product, partial [Brassica napus]